MSALSWIFGRPLASREQHNVKIGVGTGVPAMGLDAICSSAYGPEAALAILIPLGVLAPRYIGPILVAVLALLAMLYVSYRQTIAAYPVNGGSYTVARENLGVWPSLIAAAALMIDYILNVAVGISAGVAALVSAFPFLFPYTVWICLGVLLVITLLNLRGTAEAGLVFSVPTYLFISSFLLVLGTGVFRALQAGGKPTPVVSPPELHAALEPVSWWILLRAFASGCTAMTGVEAVSNGVGAFREPTVRTAHRTLTFIVVVLALMLGGIAYLAGAYHIGAMRQDEAGYQSVLSQLVAAIAGRGPLYYIVIGSLLATLCLSANTSFVDFPRLSQLIARDGFLPRAFAVVGRRLVFSVGIIFLAFTAGLLLLVFRGITDRLIPLFAVGAFGAFTLSQAGMVVHWHKAIRKARQDAANRRPGTARELASLRLRFWINGTGAVTTGIALAVILLAKFVEGAWITILAIPALLTLFFFIQRHYARVDAEITREKPLDLSNNPKPIVLIPIRRWDNLTAKALRFAMWLSNDVHAVHVTNLSGQEADDEAEKVRSEWARDVESPARAHGVPVPTLQIAQTPYRRFLPPLLAEIDRLKARFPGRAISVVIPEVIETRWWQLLLHARKPAKLRKALLQRGDYHIVVVSVPWYVEN
jgi:amino acid transporter